MKKCILHYKCLNCDDIEQVHTKVRKAKIKDMFFATAIKGNALFPEKILHNCRQAGENEVGVAILVGYEIDDDKPLGGFYD